MIVSHRKNIQQIGPNRPKSTQIDPKGRYRKCALMIANSSQSISPVLTLIGNIATIINQSNDLDKLLTEAQSEIEQTLGRGQSAIWLVDTDSYQVRLYNQQGLPLPLWKELANYTLPVTVADLEAEKETGQILNTIAEELFRQTQANQIETVQNYPLFASDQWLGIVSLFGHAPDQVTDEGLKVVATLLGTAIYNTRVFEAERRRRQEIEAVQQGSISLTSSLDLPEVLDAILSATFDLVPSRNSHIYLYDPQEDKITLGLARWAKGTERRYYQPESGGLTYNAARTGQMIAVEEMADHPVYSQNDGKGAIIAIPLKFGLTVVGVMTIAYFGSRKFSQNELNVLQLLSSQAAIAIHNANMFEKISTANVSKSQFLGTMSHELRTPLNAILGYSEMLREEARDSGQASTAEDLDRIYNSGKNLLHLINDILDLSKLEAGKIELHLESFSLEQLITEVKQTCQPLLDKNHNTLEIILDDLPGEMHADLTKLRQSLLNLISNASKFSQHSSIVLEIRRLVRNASDWIVFQVTDKGIGMSPEQVAKLFQPFMQVDASTTRKYGGTGLGLAITKRFCQMMGGDISVESEMGQGSTFILRIPAVVVNLQYQPVFT